MNTITTTQAAARAKTLRDGGMTHKKIGRKLAREGYSSIQTGKPMTASGIARLIQRLEAGHVWADVTMHKHAKKKRAPRAKQNKTQTAMQPVGIEAIAAAQTQTQHPFANSTNNLDYEMVARRTMKNAMEKVLLSLFGVKTDVLLPLDTVFRSTHS